MIFAAHDDYSLKCRDQWILSWPGQGILCVSQLMWTAEVHVALQKGSKVIDHTFGLCGAKSMLNLD